MTGVCVFRCVMYLIFILIVSGVSKYAGVLLKDASHVDEVFNTVLKVALIFICGVVNLAFMLNLFSCMLDLLWLSIPAFRLIMNIRHLQTYRRHEELYKQLQPSVCPFSGAFRQEYHVRYRQLE